MQGERLAVTPAALLAFAALMLGGAPPANAAAVDRGLLRSWADVAGTVRAARTPDTLIVVFRAPAAAERSGAIGTTDANGEAADAQAKALGRLAESGLQIEVVRSFTRTINAVEARVPAAQRWRLAHAADVAAVFAVRSIVPASIADDVVAALGPSALPVTSGLPLDGAGVEIAVLDGPIDASHQALAGRVDYPAGVVPPATTDGSAAHGTAIASIAAGSIAAGGGRGVAGAARILAVGVLASGPEGALTGTTADLLAGLEMTADPNGDGDLSDHVRVAVAAVSAPFASFADSPEARAIAGLDRIGTVVVAASGNDGATGTALGTISSPGAAPTALTVGATDGRAGLPQVSASFHGDLLADTGLIPLAGGLAPPAATSFGVALVGGFGRTSPPAGSQPADYRTADGSSAVAGLAVLVPRDGGDLSAKIAAAAQAGAASVLVYGRGVLPAGALGVDDAAAIPVISIDDALGQQIAEVVATGGQVTVEFGGSSLTPNGARGTIAPFSSTGLGYGGAVKPDIVLPGVAIEAARPGGGWRSVTGTSAAAAQAAGLVAALAALHPDWSAARLRGALVSTADLVLDGDGVAPVEGQGGGAPDAAAASVAPLALSPATLALGVPDGSGRVKGSIAITNTTATDLTVSLGVLRDATDGVTLDVAAEPARFVLTAGARADLPVAITIGGAPTPGSVVGGWLVATPDGGAGQRIPFAILVPGAGVAPIATASLGADQLDAGAAARPIELDLGLGSIAFADDGSLTIGAVARLRVDVLRGGHRVARMYAARDLLPGRYRFAVRAVDATGRPLPAGRYRLVVSATGVDGTPALRSFALRVR